MIRILLTGARAPATLHLARCLRANGYRVFTADSCRFPITRGSDVITRFFKVPSPVSDSEAFIRCLLQIIESHHIDWLIPTCEEVFHISQHLKSLQKVCHVLTDSIDRLHQLHNKWAFSQLIQDAEVQAPETHRIDTPAEFKLWEARSRDYVFKPVYSRFASRMLICPQPDALATIYASRTWPWIAQKFISGTEYSSYSVAHNGKITLHGAYYSKYRAGRGAGIYFVPVYSEKIKRFVTRFAAQQAYTGQLAFDFIEDTQGSLYVLECNPRLTSGIHLFSSSEPIAPAFLNRQLLGETCLSPQSETIPMLASMMWLYGVMQNSAPKFLTDLCKGTDILWTDADPVPCFYQLLSLLELGVRSVKNRQPLLAASTMDIEWNGYDT